MQPYIYLVPYQEVVVISIEKDEYDILLEAFKRILEVYKGCPITSARDKFMIDYYSIQNRGKE